MLQVLVLLLPLGILAGLLSGLLGIGGGLVFSPLLLLLGLSPHQALATSTLAIVPTTAGGSWEHLRNGRLPWRSALAIGTGALLFGLLFGHLGSLLTGWQLLGLQAGMYGLLSLTISPRGQQQDLPIAQLPQPLLGLLAVGAVAGLAGGMLGVGGGLVMVPLLVSLLRLPIHHAIRLSTFAVCCASSGAGLLFLHSGRGQLLTALVLGLTAAVAARWSASRLQGVAPQRLAWMLRLLTILLALDSGRRALMLLFQAGGTG
jgi:uncharacterized membrane protein YfcA